MSPRNLGISGLVIAFVIALPLFVWTAINVNFNLGERAQGAPNSCGGTCGSNFNCQANLYCYKGFCRNPLCSEDTDCTCSQATSSAVPTTKSSTEPKGGRETISPNETLIPIATFAPLTPIASLIPQESLENKFVNKYALSIFVGFIILILTVLILATRKKKIKQIPQITPPTNI